MSQVRVRLHALAALQQGRPPSEERHRPADRGEAQG